MADIDARRARIVETIGDLQDFAKPGNLANRGMSKAVSFFVNEEGKARPERVAMAVAVLLGVVGLLSRDDD